MAEYLVPEKPCDTCGRLGRAPELVEVGRRPCDPVKDAESLDFDRKLGHHVDPSTITVIMYVCPSCGAKWESLDYPKEKDSEQ